MKKPFPYYRFVQSDDDGCNVFECLACKCRWNVRYGPANFCGGCGIKFLGVHECKSVDDKSWRWEVKKSEKSVWVIEARRVNVSHVERSFDWLAMDSYPRHSTQGVLDLLKRYRLQEELQKERSAFEGGNDYGYEEDMLFRARLVDSRVSVFNRAGVDYPSSIEYLKRDHEYKMAEIKESKGVK